MNGGGGSVKVEVVGLAGNSKSVIRVSNECSIQANTADSAWNMQQIAMTDLQRLAKGGDWRKKGGELHWGPI